MFIDLHVHSVFSGDNDADPEGMILAAIEKGLDGLAFTEHYSNGASELVERLRGKYGKEMPAVQFNNHSSPALMQ